MATVAATRQFPSHFARDNYPLALRQVPFIIKKLSVPILGKDAVQSESNGPAVFASYHRAALEKFWEQTRASLPHVGNDGKVSDFLDQAKAATPEYQALADEYLTLQQRPAGELGSYLKATQESTKAFHEKFKLYSQNRKKQFHVAYKDVCPDEKLRNELWKKYEANERKYMVGPVDEFSETMSHDGLIAQALIHYVNRLGEKDGSVSEYQDRLAREKFDPKSQYTDSKGKSVNVQYDKKTGLVSEIRVDALSGAFPGKALSGDLGDAFAILAASNQRNVPIKIVVPISLANQFLADSDPGALQALILLIFHVSRMLQERHYKNRAIEGALQKGISLHNISFMDTVGQPIVFSESLKKEVEAKQREWAANYQRFGTLDLNASTSPSTPPPALTRSPGLVSART